MKKNLLYIILIFILALGLRLIAIEKKSFIHHDEPLSFASSTLNNTLPNGSKFKYTWWRFNVENNEYDLKEFKKSFFQSKSSLNSIKKDLIDLRKGNIEVEHTNLYYSVLRVWNAGLEGTNIKECIRRACYLNLLFFIIEFFFMYKLLNLIKPDDYKFINLGLFFAFCNTAGISNVLLIREYALAEMFFVIATYYACLIIKKDNITIKSLFTYSLVFAFLALSNYMLLVYDGILAIFLLGYKIYKKQSPAKVITMIFLSFMWLLLIYPVYFNSIFNNQYSLIINANFRSFRIHRFNYNNFIFYNSIISTILLGVIFITKKIYKPLFLVVVPTLVWSFIIIWLIPWANMRFVFPSIPILSLIFTMLLYYFKSTYIITICLLYLTLTITPIFNKTFKYTKIDYLYGDEELYDVNILKNTTIPSNGYPIVVYNIVQARTWYYTYWYFIKLENSGRIIFVDKLPENDFPYKKFYLMMYLPLNEMYNISKYCNTTLSEQESWPDYGIYEVCFVEFDK